MNFFWRGKSKRHTDTAVAIGNAGLSILRKNKICCTIGPSCSDDETLLAMIREGMNMARFNLSHSRGSNGLPASADLGSYDGAHNHLEVIKRLSNLTKPFRNTSPIGIILDTRGKEIRTIARQEPLELQEGQLIELVSEDMVKNEGNTTDVNQKSSESESGLERVIIKFDSLHSRLKPDQTIRMQDGEVAIRIQSIDHNSTGIMICKVLFDATLGPDSKSIFLPEEVPLPAAEILKPEDVIDLDLLSPYADGILLSFTESADEVEYVRNKYSKNQQQQHQDIEIISKIESIRGVKNLDSIIDVSDGIVVARGDLGMAIDSALHSVQKHIIKKSNQVGIPCWVATQLLESMGNSRKPTVAELSDISNSVLDGADTLMLSAETATGQYPVDAVRVLCKTAYDAQRQLDFEATQKTTNNLKQNYLQTHRRLMSGFLGRRLKGIESASGRESSTYENLLMSMGSELQQEVEYQVKPKSDGDSDISTEASDSEEGTSKPTHYPGSGLKRVDTNVVIPNLKFTNGTNESSNKNSNGNSTNGSTEQAQSILLEEIIVKNAAQIANDVPRCKLILAISASGLTASLLAKARPHALILLLTDDPSTQRRFLQVRGVKPVLIQNCGKISDQLVSAYDSKNEDSMEYVRAQQSEIIDRFEKEGVRIAKEEGLVQEKDRVFVVRSMPYGYDQILKIVQRIYQVTTNQPLPLLNRTLG